MPLALILPRGSMILVCVCVCVIVRVSCVCFVVVVGVFVSVCAYFFSVATCTTFIAANMTDQLSQDYSRQILTIPCLAPRPNTAVSHTISCLFLLKTRWTAWWTSTSYRRLWERWGKKSASRKPRWGVETFLIARGRFIRPLVEERTVATKLQLWVNRLVLRPGG